MSATTVCPPFGDSHSARWTGRICRASYLEDKRPDIHAFPDARFMLDVCVALLLLLLVLVSLLALRISLSRRVRFGGKWPFVPFAFESFGGLGPAAISFLRDLASYAKESFLRCE